MISRTLLSLTAIAAVATALFGAALLSPQPASADGHAVCVDLAPGEYQIDVPAVAGERAGALRTTVGEGGEITSLFEPGGRELVALGALPGLAPLYADVMTIDGEKVNLVDCPWMGADAMDDAMEDEDAMEEADATDDAMSMPNSGSGGLLSAASSIGSAIPMIALGAGAAASALIAALGFRRRR